jgi:prephenate dehydrogenase
MRQITIIGTGLIGGSLALALRKRKFAGRIIGCDRESALKRAKMLGVIDNGFADPADAVRGSQVVVLATPVLAIVDLIGRLGPGLPATTLLTDVGSTKAAVAERALKVFGKNANKRFLPGHPMAGKEHSGVEYADADLFQSAVWFLTPLPGQNLNQGLFAEFVGWIDRIEEAPLLPAGGRALREMTRIAASPYSVWRDIAISNKKNLEDTLLKVEQRLAHIRENLATRALAAEFEQAHGLKKSAEKKR